MLAFFELEKNNTSIKTEIVAGITTFMTMAYIIFVNPQILSAAGMDQGAVMTATIVVAAFSCIVMGLMTNYPFALASGMGLNAFFAYSIAPTVGWQGALAAVFISGIFFIIFALTGVVNLIDEAIPASLKHAVASGIGLFIAFIGLKNAGIIVPSVGTIVGAGELSDTGPLLAITGLGITAALMSYKIKGSILLGIIITTLISFIAGYQEMPNGLCSIVGAPASLEMVAFKLNFSAIWEIGIMAIFALVFVDMFDTMGTFMGTGASAGYLNEKGHLPKMKQAMIADAIGTIAGALFGTSTVTTYVESSSGISMGGRTGLTTIVVGLLFLASLIFAPFAALVPNEATAPALIIVGVLMCNGLKKINFDDFSESFPAFVTMIIMPFTFSIAHGIAAGFIAYPLVKVCSGKSSDLNWFNYILAVVSIMHFI